MHLVPKAWIVFFSQLAESTFHSRTGWMWRETCRAWLPAKLNVLHRQILFSLAIAAIAKAILMPNSAKQVPSLCRVAPMYWKLATSSNFWPFMRISALMVFVLLVMVLLFSVLTSIPHAFALSLTSGGSIPRDGREHWFSSDTTLADGSEIFSQPHPGNRFYCGAKLSEGLVRF